MSDTDVILLIYAGCAAAFVLCFLVAETRHQWRCWMEKRGRPARLAELDRQVEERNALQALTQADREWLIERGATL